MVEGVADRVESSGRGDEICGYDLGSLVNELVERVLSVGSSSAPDNRLKTQRSVTARILSETMAYTSLIIHALTTLGNELSIGFHISLLEVVGKLVKILVVGKKELSLSTVEVVVPDADDG